MSNKFNVKLATAADVALFVAECGQFDPDINYSTGKYVVDAKSVLGVLSVGLETKAKVEINTDDKRMIDTFIDHIKLWIVEE